MKHLLLATVAASLLVSGVAQAQTWRDRQGDGQSAQSSQPGSPRGDRGAQRGEGQRGEGQRSGRGQGTAPVQARPQAQAQAQTQPQAQPRGEAAQPQSRPENRSAARGRDNDRSNDRAGYPSRDNRRADNRSGQHGRDWRSPQRFRAGAYALPRGYASRGWSYGQTLPRAYWADQYILADYFRYGLRRPPAGMQWIRVGADALLISRGGQVFEVARYLFW